MPLQGIYPKEMKSVSQRAICTPTFTALFTIAKVWKQPMCVSTDEWIMKMWYIHTMDYYSATRKKEALFVTCMNLEDVMHSEKRERRLL